MRFLAFLPLAALAACSSFDSPCEVINAAQSGPDVQTCVFSASVDEDGTFSTDEGAPVAFDAPFTPPTEGAFPDGSRLDGESGVITTALAPEAGLYALAMRADGAVLVRDASGQPLATVRVAEGENAEAARLGIAGEANRASFLAFAPEADRLYATDTQGNVFAWDVASGETLWTSAIPYDHGGQDGGQIRPDAIRGLAVSADGARVAAASTQRVDVWDATSGEVVASWQIPRKKTSVIGVGFAPGGEHVAVMSSGRYVPPTVRYSSFDETGQYTGASEKLDVEGYSRAPTVFLMAIP